MSSSSVSFRISRHTQDLAETVHALSQRLVTMEQRLEALDLQLQALRQQPREAEEAEAASLAPIEAHIERLLQDCRQLLADQPSGAGEVPPLAQLTDAEAESSLPADVQAERCVPQPDASLQDVEEDADAEADDLTAVHAA